MVSDKPQYPAGYGIVAISSKAEDNILGRSDAAFLGLNTEIKGRSFTMKKITQIGLSECVDLLMEKAMQSEKTCLSISLDALDKAFYDKGAVGGMTTRELIYSVQRLKLMKNLKTAEIAGNDSMIIAKIIKELT